MIRLIREEKAFAESSAEHCDMIRAICLAVRELCVASDLRFQTSCAYDNGKLFVKDSLLVQSLISVTQLFRTKPALSSSALSTLRAMVTCEEAANAIAQGTIVEVILEILTCYQDITSFDGLSPSSSDPSTSALSEMGASDHHSCGSNGDSTHAPCALSCAHGVVTEDKQKLLGQETIVALIKSCFGLVRNLCGDDRRKAAIVRSGIVPLLLLYASTPPYMSDRAFMENAMACLACICLRSPSNSEQIVSLGGASVVAQAMRRHASSAAVTRQCCLVARNASARSAAVRSALLDAGLELLLRTAGATHSAVVDESYAALRDLGCDAKMVRVDAETGVVSDAFEAFGEGPDGTGSRGKLNFNPVFEATESLQIRIVEESRAPFASPSIH